MKGSLTKLVQEYDLSKRAPTEILLVKGPTHRNVKAFGTKDLANFMLGCLKNLKKIKSGFIVS